MEPLRGETVSSQHQPENLVATPRQNPRDLGLGLRDQHAVEGIAMMWRQRRQPLCVLERYRKRLKAADLHAERKRDLEAEHTEADLDRRLPGRRQADINRFSGADFVAGALA
jgi:hypothetical protein